jgi:hypothetical protein
MTDKEKLELECKNKKLEILNLDKEIRQNKQKLFQAEKSKAELIKNIDSLNKDFEKEKVKLKDIQFECKVTLSKAKETLENAQIKEDHANKLLKDREHDLEVLRRDIGIYQRVKEQERHNQEELKRINDKSVKLDKSIENYQKLIEKNRHISGIEKKLKNDQLRLDSIIYNNQKKSERLERSILDNDIENGRMKSELIKVDTLKKETEQLNFELNKKIDLYHSLKTNLEVEKRNLLLDNKKTIEKLEFKISNVNIREKKLENILERIRKDKTNNDMLKEVGL